jgi:hypothetical protein
VEDSGVEVKLRTDSEEPREHPCVIRCGRKALVATNSNIVGSATVQKEASDCSLGFQVKPIARALVLAFKGGWRETVLTNGSHERSAFVVETLVTTVSEVTEEVVGIDKVAVRYSENDTGRARDSSLCEVALDADGMAAGTLSAGRKTELNQTGNTIIVYGDRRFGEPRELGTIRTVGDVERAVERRNARDNKALRGRRGTRGRRRGSSARGGIRKGRTSGVGGIGRNGGILCRSAVADSGDKERMGGEQQGNYVEGARH